jgi:hypothetical protein
MALQMAYFDRIREPVVMDVGPVLDLEDVVGGKVCALTSRAYERDYLDTAAALERYSPAELIAFARRLDPGLEGRDFAEAAQRLDHMPDYAFTSFGLSQHDVARLRERFAAWLRQAEAVSAEAAEGTGIIQPGRTRATDEPAAGPPDQLRGARQAESEGSQIEPDEPEIEP